MSKIPKPGFFRKFFGGIPLLCTTIKKVTSAGWSWEFAQNGIIYLHDWLVYMETLGINIYTG